MILAAIEEKLRRPGLLGLTGKKHEREMQQHLESYFRTLGRRIAALNLHELVTGHSKETILHAVKARLRYPIRTLTPLLKTTLEAGIQDAIMSVGKIHHFAEAEDDSADSSGLVLDDASNYASQYAGELVTGINDTTQQLIADAVEQGLDDQLGVQGTAKLIREALDSMTTYRSQMIATTEMNAAMSQGMLMKLGNLGIAYKQWITATQCCDECAENEDASPIPTDEDFPSGDSAPPAHPNCRCAVAGAQAPA